MVAQPRDPLLIIARIITWFFIGVLGLVAVLLVVAAPVVVLSPDVVTAKIGGSLNSSETFAAVAGILGVAGLMGLAVWFFYLLLRIIDSVGEGDPFAPVNAERLNRMAWISLAGYFATIPLAALVGWLAKLEEGAHEVQVDFDLDGSLLVPLILFILARVFRHGAAMREDLEGTV